MYYVLYNSEHSPIDIANWLNEEKSKGMNFIACKGDFYIFEAVEQPLALDGVERCAKCGQPAYHHDPSSFVHPKPPRK